MDKLAEIVQKINSSKNIAILYHVNADGDALGSSLALYLSFCNGKNIHIYGEEEIQNNLKFLPNSSEIIINNPSDDIYDLAIGIDAGGMNRFGQRAKIFNNAKFKINIDHHVSNDINGDINLVDAESSACGEIIYRIIKEAGHTIDKNIATCLYTAIMTDTGSFKFSNTTAFTHRMAAELIECGIQPNIITRSVYDNVPLTKLKLIGIVLDSIELHYNNKVSILTATNDMLVSTGSSYEDLDNIANYGINIENVELSIFLKEQNLGKTRISFRSKSVFDCSEFARSFGGGGHIRASGCEIDSPPHMVRKIILDRLKDKSFE